MISSTIPFAILCHRSSPAKLSNGKTAIEGLSLPNRCDSAWADAFGCRASMITL
ncbi:hypothetical protein SAMCCGM7_pA0300 (plasmid) [Sinorhizobium americanum CCGM7]|nr:hypothetical protein SAMCCGM7_pA0300 [Sinorhizobium americanum CCGM7]